MSTTKAITSIIPGMMSLSLAGKTIKMAKESFSKPKKKVNFMKNSVSILTGIPLISATSGLINKLP